MDIEPEIKKQFSKIFRITDWRTFKFMADYYFRIAAITLKKDIDIDAPYKLMGRNIQKRLFIGIGTELLLKALFLKNDYCINRIKKKKQPNPNKPTKFSMITNPEDLDDSNTFGLDNLINNLSNLITIENYDELEKGLKIAKVFRNKEGHVVSLHHEPDTQNYRDIEKSIKMIYENGFNENIEFQIAFEHGEKAKFNKKPGVNKV